MGRLLFILLSLIYLVLYALKQNSINVFWISGYAADVLCLPISLSIIRFVMVKFNIIKPDIELSLAMVFAAVILYGIVFEIYLPTISFKYIGDYWDIMAYFVGGTIYYIFRNYKRYKVTA